MSKNATRGAAVASKSNPKSNELPRKTTKSPATSVAAATTTKAGTLLLKKQDSVDSERALRKTTRAATNGGTKPPMQTNKNKERESVASKRTTPSPTIAKVAPTLRARQQQQRQQLQPPAATAKGKPNAVLDTYHSVTVASPPQKRRVPAKQIKDQGQSSPPLDKVAAHQQRARTLTRTLQPEEVLVLKRDSAKQRLETEIQKQTLSVKEPVAFEVNFEAAKPSPAAEAESDNYSDDFESYESDFETGSSTAEDEEEPEEEQASAVEDAVPVRPASHSNVFTDAPALAEEDEEDSEPTQNPITVIQREKEHDSGHYELHTRQKHPRLSELTSQSTQQYDSFDTFSNANSEQLDSGISSYGTTTSTLALESQSDTFYGGYADFVRRPVLTKRGAELMSKLRFDQLQFKLFDMKPISYEGYMQTYGKLNTCQTATQTQAQHLDEESQTERVELRSSWTQHPPHYAGQQQLLLASSSEAGLEEYTLPSTSDIDTTYERSLAQLQLLRQLEQQRTMQQQRQRLARPTDFERLNAFLHNAALLMGKLLSAKNSPGGQQAQLRREPAALGAASLGYKPLQTSLLNALQVRRIFGSSGETAGQLLVTVHECPPRDDVYRADFANLLMVWSATDTTKPLRLLSTWAEVCRVEFCSEAPDIVVAGLRDGSVAMWDLRETYTYCSKLDGHLTHFAATQSVVPSLEAGAIASDLGAVVDVRSFRTMPRTGGAMAQGLTVAHKAIQYASLNDSGLLTIWTLVETTSDRHAHAGGATGHEFSSPWARVKLLQSAICDLRAYVERRLLKSQTAYDKTKSLFQGNIYSDELLRELNETQTVATALQGQGMQGLRFTSIDTGCERIYVCTNRNFVLSCTKSLKPERFARIALNESRFLFPTALCVLSNEDFLAVGLSNGSVMILNCNQRQRQRLQAKPSTAVANKTPPSTAPDSETGKSCAIQNIILNERRSFDSSDSYEVRPDTAACLDLINRPRRSYELRVYDQQLLLSGSALRQHLVQSLVLSSDGWRLFALANGAVRTYDFFLDKELVVEPNGPRVADIAVARTSANEQHLILLDSKGEVQLHTLK